MNVGKKYRSSTGISMINKRYFRDSGYIDRELMKGHAFKVEIGVMAI